MKKILLGTVGAVALAVSAPAGAADMAARPYTKAPVVAPAPIYTWTGFYVGIQGGGGWGRSNETFFLLPNSPVFLGSQSYDTSGGFVGGVFGYNWQSGPVVFGIEGDYHWADINGRSAEVNLGVGDSFFTRIRGFGDIKGRLGYSTGPALWFVSGGAAVGDLQHRYDNPFGGSAATSTTRWGWTVGAGAEYMFAPNWSAKVEYNYIDFGRSTLQYDPTPANRSEWTDTVHTVKAGVNYHFNWGGPVVAKY
ncbi:porin family protein [Bradyrhizobium manausense]|uniref:outer membrane protein n=1 Tax=Bradyrhizobium TaxID=374 RepID=UPI001BAA4FD2|nr:MULTISPECIES: outer membrane beta-barrel protein [Bradyrhizobium]MBR0828147.1 porin family protein [Bradyrhizobium manausense]UVO33002.1 outer membrane beta-barrel protein [Bradyrhizobium arachidis]